MLSMNNIFLSLVLAGTAVWQQGNVREIIFIEYLVCLFAGGAPKSLQMVTAAMKLKDTCSLEKSYDQPTQHI